MHLGDKERLNLWGMGQWFKTDAARFLEEFTQSTSDLLSSGEVKHLLSALANIKQIKSIFQRIHNYNHQLARLAAKSFLESEFPALPWSEIEFADDDNAPGPDILVDRETVRIVGAVKTTEPCGRSKSGMTPTKFGGNQKEEITKDLRNLSSAKYASHERYMFVTSALAFQILKDDFRYGFPMVCFVLLSASVEVSRPGRGRPAGD